MYNEKVIDLFQHPKNVGAIKDANGVGMVGNQVCGDIMKLYLKINDNEIIDDASFETFGCTAAIVSSSVATGLIKGKTIDEALKLENQEIIDILGGLPPQKIHCSVLAKEAIEKAIEDYKNNKNTNLSTKTKKKVNNKN